MKITSISVLLTRGTDIVILTTDLPTGTPKVSNEKLYIKFDTEKDTGIAYCEKHFPNVTVKVISDR